MEAADALGAAAPILESIPNPPGIRLQLLCGVRIELAVGSLPYLALAWYPSMSLPHAMFCAKKGCYKQANPLGLRLNPTRSLPTNGLDPWSITTTTKTHCVT